MQILNIERGSVADSLYLQISDHSVSYSFEVSPDIILDLDENDEVVGVDCQNVSALEAEHQSRSRTALLPAMKLQLVPA